MIDVRAPAAPGPTVQPKRRWWPVFVGVVAMLLSGGALFGGLRWDQGGPPAAAPSTPAVAALPPAPSPAPPAPSTTGPPPGLPALSTTGLPPGLPALSTTGLPPGLLQMAVAVPVRGTGKFQYARGRGAVLGSSGPLRRFHVAAEIGSGEDVAGFAAQVEATLGDPRSWVGGGGLRLQRMSPADPVDFTVFLATRESAAEMCSRGGTNIRQGGIPYTSCRTTGRAIINLDRWRRSAPPYVAARVPLAVYRQYVINHEVGHELGHHHEGCRRPGSPAPVMVQQTLDLGGCVPNAWPRRGDAELAGPPA
jgi:uncharacterized protein DUF3152